MQVIKTISKIKAQIQKLKIKDKTIGFIPTMGALHQGHISLIKQSVCKNDITVCSIFVNPIQFNDKNDYQKYPNTLKKDLELLKIHGCDIVFTPEKAEMYPEIPNEKYDFGYLESCMEGKFRPNHFNGVAIVVNRLFEIIQPDYAYFGKKDYQQLAIIKALVKQKKHQIEIVPCEIVREPDGLAMSSRNMRLSEIERSEALLISKTLFDIKKSFNDKNINQWKQLIEEKFANSSILKLEYIEFADSETLEVINNAETNKNIAVFIAAYAGNIRLIDNIVLPLQ